MYAERNLAIIAEINELPYLELGDVVGQNERKTSVAQSLGSLHSKTINSEIHLLLKSGDSYSMPEKIAFHLGLMDEIDEHFPDELEKFPLFMGRLFDDRGEYMGIITEDFSEGNVHSVVDAKQKEYWPVDIVKYLGRTKNFDDLYSVAFLVNDQIRFGDLGEFNLDISQDFRRKFIQNYLFELDKYTVKLPLKTNP